MDSPGRQEGTDVAVPKAAERGQLRYSEFFPRMHRGRDSEVPECKNSAWTISCLAQSPMKRDIPPLLPEPLSGEWPADLGGNRQQKRQVAPTTKRNGPIPWAWVGRKPGLEDTYPKHTFLG